MKLDLAALGNDPFANTAMKHCVLYTRVNP
jgi:hypothetical protein